MKDITKLQESDVVEVSKGGDKFLDHRKVEHIYKDAKTFLCRDQNDEIHELSILRVNNCYRNIDNKWVK